MFRHKGKNRTFIHNLKLAALLSFVAGIVNISGVLAVKTLTTNVTGHFAFFAEELFKKNYSISFAFLFFILCFLLGSFIANVMVEITSLRNPRISHIFPMIMEIIILSLVGIFGNGSSFLNFNNQLIACFLLFAMGMQNSLVTQVSQSIVRTTHLTGLFTDLGIELSQLFFYRKPVEFQQLSKSIYLRIIIIACFFTGCIIGGLAFKMYELKTLLLASGCLTIALFYDNLRYRFYILKRKHTTIKLHIKK